MLLWYNAITATSRLQEQLEDMALGFPFTSWQYIGSINQIRHCQLHIIRICQLVEILSCCFLSLTLSGHHRKYCKEAAPVVILEKCFYLTLLLSVRRMFVYSVYFKRNNKCLMQFFYEFQFHEFWVLVSSCRHYQKKSYKILDIHEFL